MLGVPLMRFHALSTRLNTSRLLLKSDSILDRVYPLVA